MTFLSSLVVTETVSPGLAYQINAWCYGIIIIIYALFRKKTYYPEKPVFAFPTAPASFMPIADQKNS